MNLSGRPQIAMSPWLAAVAGAGAQMGSAAIAANEQANARDQAAYLAQQSINDLTATGVPPDDALRITLEKLKSEGQLTPELEQYIAQQGTELAGIETDPRLKDAQLEALDSLRTLSQGGFSIGDKAALDKALTASAIQERGAREAILQDMAQRGASTSGASVAAQLANQQGAATRGNEAALETAAQGYQRELDAIRNAGTLAGQMQGTEFGQKAQVATAQDVINKMNTEAQQNVQQRNLAAKNAAQQQNLAERQRIADANVGLSNQQEIYNKQVPQQSFENRLKVAQTKANTRAGQATNVISGGNQVAQTIAGAGAGAKDVGVGLSNYFSRQQQQNEDEEQKRNY